MPTDFLSVLHEFQERGIRYVLVGGLAVVLRGVDRLTGLADAPAGPSADEART
jgi:hypothetical protein